MTDQDRISELEREVCSWPSAECHACMDLEKDKLELLAVLKRLVHEDETDHEVSQESLDLANAAIAKHGEGKP